MAINARKGAEDAIKAGAKEIVKQMSSVDKTSKTTSKNIKEVGDQTETTGKKMKTAADGGMKAVNSKLEELDGTLKSIASSFTTLSTQLTNTFSELNKVSGNIYGLSSSFKEALKTINATAVAFTSVDTAEQKLIKTNNSAAAKMARRVVSSISTESGIRELLGVGALSNKKATPISAKTAKTLENIIRKELLGGTTDPNSIAFAGGRISKTFQEALLFSARNTRGSNRTEELQNSKLELKNRQESIKIEQEEQRLNTQKKTDELAISKIIEDQNASKKRQEEIDRQARKQRLYDANESKKQHAAEMKLIDKKAKSQEAILDTKAQREINKTESERVRNASKEEVEVRKVARERQKDYENQLKYEQILKRNAESRLAWRQRMGDMFAGTDDVETNLQRRLDNAINRVKDTWTRLNEQAENPGAHKGTIGMPATSKREIEALRKAIYETAKEQRLLNSEEGKFAQTLGRVVEDSKKLQSSVNRVHTAFGQLASSASAIRGIAAQLRQTMTRIAQPVLRIVQGVSSQAFKSALDAMKTLELSEIGFENFFGKYAVSSIMANVKQNALLSPMSAAQLAGYVSQIAPLSNGNSTLATNAAMGVAKMIQYSGSDVTTEMEYVVRNLRDVIAKGKATTIDIRQFNRAMPALKKVLQEMGLEEFLKDGEISINKENANQLLQAFAKVNESEQVGDIFNKTSETIAGLMERMEEQVQFLLIDVADFSGLTKYIKDTIHEILDSSDGIISDIKMSLQFIANNIMRWFKSRDWESIANSFSEAMNIVWTAIKEAVGTLRDALGGFDWRTTLKNFAKLIGEFIKGIANSYSWLLGIMDSLSSSGILGSGLLQAGSKVLGFMSGNAGVLITGTLRSFGNAMGVLNQVIGVLIRTLEAWHQRLLVQLNEISSFSQALAIVTDSSAILAESFKQLTASIGMSIESLQQEALERRAAFNAEKAQQLASSAGGMATGQFDASDAELSAAMAGATAKKSSGLLGPSATGVGTKLYAMISSLISKVMSGLLVGSATSMISEKVYNAFSSDRLGSRVFGNTVGSIAGGAMIGGQLGGPLGLLGGGALGIAKALVDAVSAFKEERQRRVDEVKEEVSQGNYLRNLLEETKSGNRISSNDFDALNSALVKQANNFNAAFPNGTAQMLKDYLSQTVVNGKNIHDAIVEADKDFEEQSDNLWSLIESGEIEKANEYANTLYENAGYSNAQVTAAILRGAVKAGLTNENGALADLMLQWGNVQTSAGTDLTYAYIQDLQEKIKNGNVGNAQAEKGKIVNQLTTLWTQVGQNLVKDSTLSDDQKKSVAKEFASGMIHYLFGEELSTGEKGAMNRLFEIAKIDDASKLGLSISPSEAAQLYSLANLYGLNSENIKRWYNDSKGKSAEENGVSTYYIPDNIRKAVEDSTTSIQEAFDAVDKNYEKLGLTTEETLEMMFNKSGEVLDKYTSILDEATNIINSMQKISDQQAESLRSINAYKQIVDNIEKYGWVHKAAGGPIRGVDTVPTMLQPGEYIVRKSTVDRIGLTTLNALNTGNVGYFARAFGRQNIYGDYSNARTWNTTSNDNRKSINNIVKVYNNSRGSSLNRYYSLANRLA